MLALTFPVVFSVGSLRIPAHFVLEALAYTVGFEVYRRLRARRGDVIGSDMRWTVIAAAAVGAAVGSKVLSWFEDPRLTLEWIRTSPAMLMSGKTIVGGFLGGTIAVELVKKVAGEQRSTGDLFVIPLCIGTAIGRVGCFLSGLEDHTFGTPTSLPWGVDVGDGIARHPTQIYEVAFVLTLAAVLWRLSRANLRNGDLFKLFMVSYLGFRLLIDGIKPGVAIGGLTAIQWACVAAVLSYGRHLPRIVHAASMSTKAVLKDRPTTGGPEGPALHLP